MLCAFCKDKEAVSRFIRYYGGKHLFFCSRRCMLRISSLDKEVGFVTPCLLSRQGFMNGDLLFDIMLEYEIGWVGRKELLCAVVEELVVPELRKHFSIEIQRSDSSNPIRATKINGKVVTTEYPDIALNPDIVNVPVKDILKVADSLVGRNNEK